MSPSWGGSRCCVCRSSQALPLPPRLCREVAQHPRRRASDTEVGWFPASDRPVEVADSQLGDSPFPRRSGRPPDGWDGARQRRDSSSPPPGCFEPPPTGLLLKGDAVPPSSSCLLGGLLLASAAKLQSAFANVGCQAVKRCQRGRTPPPRPVV